MTENETLKLKKKVVSLVSNYNSDEEISGSDGEENEKSFDQQEQEQLNASNDQSNDQAVEEIKNLTEMQIQAEENVIKNSPTIDQATGFDSSDNTNNQELSDEVLDPSIFTLDNGFLPGSESIRLPLEPSAECSKALQDKIIRVRDRMERFNYHINEDIQSKKHFKNPSIYEKLIEHYDLDEYGSNFSSHVQDLKANGYLFYEELDIIQRNEWAKKEKERKDRATK